MQGNALMGESGGEQGGEKERVEGGGAGKRE